MPVRMSTSLAPLPVKRLLQNIHGLKTQIHDGGRRRFNLSVAQTADQILDAVCNCSESLRPTIAAEPFTV